MTTRPSMWSPEDGEVVAKILVALHRGAHLTFEEIMRESKRTADEVHRVLPRMLQRGLISEDVRSYPSRYYMPN